MPHKSHISNALVITVDARWGRSLCGEHVMGFYAVEAMGRHFSSAASTGFTKPESCGCGGLDGCIAQALSKRLEINSTRL